MALYSKNLKVTKIEKTEMITPRCFSRSGRKKYPSQYSQLIPGVKHEKNEGRSTGMLQ